MHNMEVKKVKFIHDILMLAVMKLISKSCLQKSNK